jgi:D-alanine-D-alanine ligase
MRFAVVFGAKSYEHEISIVSAIALKDVISSSLVYIFIDKDREFYHIPYENIKSKLFSSGEYKKCDKLSLEQGGFFKRSLFGSKKLEFDVLINLVHGGDGEDGKLASLFEFFGVPFIGPRMVASVVSFDKYITKTYASSVCVKTLPCEYISRDKKYDVVKYPVIVKPSRLGSSIGVSIVKDVSELEYALDIAYEFDDDIVIEPFIKDVKEYNLAGAKVDGKIVFSIVEEPAKNEFLDFDKKYLDFNRTKKVNEAQISQDLQNRLKENFIKIYNNTFDGSLIRCDFFVIDNEVYLNEINPIPGSMANYLFDDFETILKTLGKNLPKAKDIQINYEYVNKIQSAKGK